MRNVLIVAALLISSAALAADGPLDVLRRFTVADLEAALADAEAQDPPDTIAAECWRALIPAVRAGVANPLPKGLGAFQAWQKARDARALAAKISSPTGPLAQLNAKCAPLLLDAQNTLLGLGIKTGLGVGSGGLLRLP